ncbi:MAG: hypothetical protein WAW96_12410 [Alphaproteobacteria bacterium]
MGRQGLMLVAGGISLALSGCTTAPTPPALAASGTYQAGYADGCKTSTERSKLFDRTIVRDESAYAKDDNYKQGWNRGFRECGSPATQNDPYSEPVPQWQKRGGPLGQ